MSKKYPYKHVHCDKCNALFINKIPTHEEGCPNSSLGFYSDESGETETLRPMTMQEALALDGLESRQDDAPAYDFDSGMSDFPAMEF